MDIERQMNRKKIDIPKFKTIVIDPPWYERGAGKIKRGADRHYELLKTEDIPPVIKNSGYWNPAKDSHLYLWVTNNFLPHGLWLINQLNYRYVTNLAWAKDSIGIGRYFRRQHELCLFAVRGKYIPTKRNDISTLIVAPKSRHSKKPEEFFTMVESASPGPYLDMFSRSCREGWYTWGLEV